MRFSIMFCLFFIAVACSTLSETNWSFLPPIENRWESVKTFGGSAEDIAHTIITTQDGGFAVVGNTQSTDGDFSSKADLGSDLFLMKFEAPGLGFHCNQSSGSLNFTKTNPPEAWIFIKSKPPELGFS